MNAIKFWSTSAVCLFAWCAIAFTAENSAPQSSDQLSAWHTKSVIRPVADGNDRHTIHAYYVHSPESPDGKYVLFYSSAAANGYQGEIRIRERATGRETVIAKNVNCEDAHRAACQQWSANGKYVVYHDVRDSRWLVAAVDVATGVERILAYDHQVGFGQATGSFTPMYGCHWKPGDFRDIELVNTATGETKTAIRESDVREQHYSWFEKQFAGGATSLFFPVVSPNEKRIFFKIACPKGGDFRSSGASQRQGLFVQDLEQNRTIFMHPKWGHPAWHANSKTIIEMQNRIIDTDAGKETRIPNAPDFPGCHPSFSPDGSLFVCDSAMNGFEGTKGEWGVVVGDVMTGKYAFIDRFENAEGAKSWRKSHPHPIFSPDGNRIYYNVSKGPHTQLYVAEITP